jgi:hypothetical protein
MKKYVKIILFSVFIISAYYIKKEKTISKFNLEVLVSMEMVFISDECEKKIEAEKNGNVHDTKDLYNIYNIYFNQYGNNMCNNDEELRSKIRENFKKNYWFVY